MDAGAFTLIERRIDFSLGSQPVSHSITAIEAAMFGMKIGSNGYLILMLMLLLMLGCPRTGGAAGRMHVFLIREPACISR